MLSKRLKPFPKPLLDDLVAGRWLPVVGAGFSRNAVLPQGKNMPLWTELGKIFERDLGEYAASSPVDAISAYEHQFGRPRLIERLSQLLLVDEARPGRVHKAFCSIPFDLVCTTNFEFLLERQYELLPRTCTPLIDETQLSINLKEAGVGLLKLHGDLNHPDRMVVSEADYDRFLSTYPLVATFLASLLISRTAVLIGYSLDDPDFRQLWQIVKDRLGRHRRVAYAILAGAKTSDIARFERRGVHVINLPVGRATYGDVLAETFEELGALWREKVIPISQVKEELPLRELSLPPSAPTRLCFFAVPLHLLSLYRERVFPIASRHGFVPVSADDVVSPGDSVQAKLEALIQRALLVVVDTSTQYTVLELALAVREKRDSARVLVILQPGADVPFDIRNLQAVIRPDVARSDLQPFLDELDTWFQQAAERYKPTLVDEPMRLLRAGEYRAAVIAAMSLLEAFLREGLDIPKSIGGKVTSLRALLEHASQQGLLENIPPDTALAWLRTRNQIVHGGTPVSKPLAEEIVRSVLRIVAPGHL